MDIIPDSLPGFIFYQSECNVTFTLYMDMKIRFIKTTLVEVEKYRLQEVWDKQFNRWDELNVDTITYRGSKAMIGTIENDTLLDVPIDSFEVVK